MPPGEPEPFPSTIKPMLARLTDAPFSDPNRLFEPKLDGFRVLAFVRKGGVSLRTRNNNDYTRHYPHVADDLRKQAQQELILDGAMVALNDRGVPGFNLMQYGAEIARRGLGWSSNKEVCDHG